MAKRERPTLDEETEIITEVKTKVTNTNQQATEAGRKERLKRAKGRHTFPTSNGGGTPAEVARDRMLGRRGTTRTNQRTDENTGANPVAETESTNGGAKTITGGLPTDGGTTKRRGAMTVTWAENPTNHGKRRNEDRLADADRCDAGILTGESEKTGAATKGGTQLISSMRRSTPEPNEDPRQKEKEKSDSAWKGNSNLDSRPEMFFLPPLVGPDDKFTPPDWFLREVKRISKHETRTPTKPPIRFELTEEAMASNANELKKVSYNLSRLIEENRHSTLHYGSEFRTVGELEPLLGRHPNFHELSSVLSHGMPYVFTRELDPLTKLDEMQTLMARGNHKSAQDNPAQVGILLGKDVTHGFAIPLPVHTIPLIPNAAVQPLGLVQQWTTKEDGTRAIKYRLTQDLSFSSNKSGPSRSINSRIDMAAYPEMIYGWCFPRILHYIVSMRIHHTNEGILISKYDYSDAYRRIAHSASAAAQTIAINDGKAYLSLRLTFGGSPNPPTWCMFSEIVTDLANEISMCEEWDHVETRSPAQPQTPSPNRLPPDVPMAQGKAMSIIVPETKGGKVDGFIDDLINVFLDTPENCNRQPHVVPLAMHVTSRPHAGEEREAVPRRPILSQPKLEAEGSPAEVQTVLGWQLDTRRLEVSLPPDKFEAWMEELRNVRVSPRVNRKDLERLLGRLNHTAYVIPIARHFLSRIRDAAGNPDTTGKRSRGTSTKLSDDVRDDLRLWETLLRQARRGISMNLLVTRQPDKICWSDACPFGIGGYNLKGRAWRVRIPRGSIVYGHNGVNNLLEFMGMVVNVWIACLEKDIDQSCILAIGDNTSAIGWLHHTANIDPTGATHGAHLKVARKLARVLIKHNCCLASQHVKGEQNVVADLLSFDGDGRGKRHPLAYDQPPDDVLTERFLRYLPTQVTENFAISRLPNEILSWVTRVLRTVESSLTVSRRAAMKTSTESGEDGKATVTTSNTEATTTSIVYPATREDCLPKRFSVSTEPPSGLQPGDLRDLVRSRWSQTLYAKPQATWLRRFGSVSGRVPCTSKDLATFTSQSGSSSRPGTTPTPPKPNSEPSRPNYYEPCSNGEWIVGSGWPPLTRDGER